jgi:hypothetical protein
MFFVSVASKGFSRIVTLLFATLAGRSISVAVKGLTARAGDPERVGVGQCTVVSMEKNRRRKLERSKPFGAEAKQGGGGSRQRWPKGRE